MRPEVEKHYGYTHAVKLGNDIKISGAVSMDDQGNPTAAGDLEQQMKNAYSDLEKVLRHYGCNFDNVIVEKVFTTDMAKFLEVSSYRRSIYTMPVRPTGSEIPASDQYADLRLRLARALRSICPSDLSDHVDDLAQAAVLRLMKGA